MEPSRPSDCAFCSVAASVLPAYIVYEDRDLIAFLDIHPLFPGHVLLSPREHYVTLLELPKEMAEKTMLTLQLLAKAVEAALDADGSFLAINNRVSQTVPHLHIHIVPRSSMLNRSPEPYILMLKRSLTTAETVPSFL